MPISLVLFHISAVIDSQQSFLALVYRALASLLSHLPHFIHIGFLMNHFLILALSFHPFLYLSAALEHGPLSRRSNLDRQHFLHRGCQKDHKRLAWSAGQGLKL